MSLYLRFLLSFLLVRAYDSKTINVFAGCETSAVKLRQRGMREGHIAVTEIRKNERTLHRERIYSITKKGIQYLGEALSAEEKEVLPLTALSVLSTGMTADRHQSAIRRAAGNTQVLTMSYASGASIPWENFDISNRKKEMDSVYDCVGICMSELDYLSLGVYEIEPHQADMKLEFHSADIVKRTAGAGNQAVSKADFNSGRYNGVLDSEAKSILLFGIPLFGFRWNEALCLREEAAYAQWKAFNEDKFGRRQSAGNCAAMLVKNPRSFSNLYHRKDDLDKFKEIDRTPFGGHFDHFYILPLDMNGVTQLRMLARIQNDCDTIETFSNAIAAKGSSIAGRTFFLNRNSDSDLFPLIDSEGNPTAAGQFLDAKQMQAIQRAAKSHSGRITVLCFDWQTPYYEAVMPDNVEVFGF